MTIPAIASEIGAHYLAAFDAHRPGLLTGLYLVGSIALDDFHEGVSDIDFVATTSRSVTAVDVAAAHAGLAGRWPQPHFDGIYLCDGELSAPAIDAKPGVAVIDGRVLANSAAERHAVTWLTLLRHGIPLRGHAPSTDWIHADIEAARQHARANLAAYWRPWIDAHRHLLSPAGLHGLSLAAVTWSVLGLARLHATLTQGLLLSKTSAGRYACEHFPEHTAIIECALAARTGLPAAFPGGPFARRAAMLACLDAMLADALGAQPG